MTINEEFHKATKAHFKESLQSALAVCGESEASGLDAAKLEALAAQAKGMGSDHLQVFLDQFYERRDGSVTLNILRLCDATGLLA